MLPPDLPTQPQRVSVLERRLARERAARLEAEAIAERVTSELYETVQQLTRSTKVAELLGDVAVQANQAASSAEAVGGALRSICSYTGWPVGHAYALDPEDAGVLQSIGVAHAADPERFAPFLELSARSRFREGEGLPGRTLLSAAPGWIVDVQDDDNFPRRDVAIACGLRAAFAAPVLIRSETAAVLEFFATGTRPPDEGLLQVVGFIGAQLGRVLERERAEELLRRQALFDGLTGLPNRVLLVDRLQTALSRCRRDGRPVHVLYLDIDDFKAINDSRGHAEGDDVLRELAARLADVLRSSDTVGRDVHDVVARLGGDEFAIVLEGADAAEAVAARIQDLVVGAPLQVGTHQVFLSVSIGSVVVEPTEQARPPEAVLAAANVAMHAAKRAGKARHVAFEPRMQDEARNRHVLGEELRQAVERQEFTVAYQPVVQLDTGVVVGAEALVRWQHPERGLVPPDVFISRAEETGVIVEMGAWVLEQACLQAAHWRRTAAPGFTVAVNISGRQLREPDFVDVVRGVLATTGLPPSALCLEMTESILMERDEAAIDMLTALRGDGVHLAIDDFGTGYSSLGALRQLPVDMLKIDRSFISGLPEDDDSGTIAWAVVRLGHTLGLPVLAEGVETDEQRAALRRFGCDQAQGFLFGRPMPADELTARLA